MFLGLLCFSNAFNSAAAAARDLRGSSSTEGGKHEFCTSQGGTVKSYTMFNGNAPGYGTAGVQISKSLPVCSFPNEDNTNVYLVALDTLAAKEPTLAVLAFKARVLYSPPPNIPNEPSWLYCSQLGGATAGDTPTSFLPQPGYQVGWWTKKADGSWFGVNDFCMFADGSAIDTWTLWYHAMTNSSANGIKFKYN